MTRALDIPRALLYAPYACRYGDIAVAPAIITSSKPLI
jgi:hypothetical protein